MIDLEIVYKQKRFYEVVAPLRKKGIQSYINCLFGCNYRLIRGRLNREEAEEFL